MNLNPAADGKKKKKNEEKKQEVPMKKKVEFEQFEPSTKRSPPAGHLVEHLQAFLKKPSGTDFTQ